jgi:hypothetical protein
MGGDANVKLGVSVDCLIKAIYDKSLTKEFKDLIVGKLGDAINKSKKLEVDDNTKKGFSLNATLELTRDDNSKPPVLKGAISVAIISVGLTPTTINIKPTSPNFADVGSNPRSTLSQGKLLVTTILEKSISSKAVAAMEAKVPESS